jgi:3-isopropylmalate dehydratase small subunit
MSEGLLISGSAFLLGDDVNTDINCSNKYLPGKDVAYVAQHAFEQLSPDIASRIAIHGGGILVAGEHFGINSSREQATHVLHQMKVRAIVAKSFGRQFFRNAINNGLPVFECDTSLIVEGQTLELDFAKGILRSEGRLLQETHPLPPEILAILSMGGLIPFLQKYPDWNFA